MRLSQLDLNLLNVFDAVMRHRRVTEAAEALALSPSAVSHALSRLRRVLNDELFVRDDEGMTPTPRALELASDVRHGLALLERALDTGPFQPGQSARTFRIAAGDYASAFLLPPLVQRLGRVAPHVNLRVVPVNRTDIGRMLNTGAVDLVIGWFDALPQELCRRVVLREDGGLVVSAGHPLAEGPLTLERIYAFPHLVVDLTGEEELSRDGFYEDRGLVRRVWMDRVVLQSRAQPGDAARVALRLPHFMAVPHFLRGSDLVATLPGRLARWATADGSLIFLGPVLSPETVDIEAVWHSRAETDQGLAWLVGTLVEVNAAA